jgi:hypothetical protein
MSCLCCVVSTLVTHRPTRCLVGYVLIYTTLYKRVRMDPNCKVVWFLAGLVRATGQISYWSSMPTLVARNLICTKLTVCALFKLSAAR